MMRLVSLARELLSREEVEEIVINMTSARLTLTVRPDRVEELLRESLEKARSFYGGLGSIREVGESELGDGTIELVISLNRGKLRDLISRARERGDEVVGLESWEDDLRARILLRSASIERALGPIIEDLKKLGFIVEYAGAELEASKTAIFAPPPTAAEFRSSDLGGSASIPLKYRAYLDLCLDLSNRYLFAI